MANVTVTFDRIDVGSDGDPGVTDGGGDFFWKLSVNGPIARLVMAVAA